MDYVHSSSHAMWLTSDNFDTPLMEQPIVSDVPHNLPLAGRVYEAVDDDEISDKLNAGFVPQPTLPVLANGVPLQGRPPSKADDGSRGIFGGPIVSSPTSFFTFSSHHEPAAVPTPHVTPRIYSDGDTSPRKDYSCQGLKHPTNDDWERWRASIVRRYQHQGAPEIVKQLRLDGYNVTYV